MKLNCDNNIYTCNIFLQDEDKQNKNTTQYVLDTLCKQT